MQNIPFWMSFVGERGIWILLSPRTSANVTRCAVMSRQSFLWNLNESEPSLEEVLTYSNQSY